MKNKLYLVKIGGSIITDINKKEVARNGVIDRLLKEIDSARRKAKIDVIIGHGGGSFPHFYAKKFKVNEGLKGSKNIIGGTLTEQAANALNMIVLDRAIKLGIPVFSFSPHSFAISRKRRIEKGFFGNIREALNRGFVPIVYGDVMIDSQMGFSIASTEEVFRAIAQKMKPDKIIIGTDVDGVFTADPKLDKKAKLIKMVTKENLSSILAMSGSSRKYDVTGGMKGKITGVYQISKDSKAMCQVVNATVPGRIYDAILGKKIISTVVKA